MNTRGNPNTHYGHDHLTNSTTTATRNTIHRPDDPRYPGSPPGLSGHTRHGPSDGSAASTYNSPSKSTNAEGPLSLTYQVVNALKRKIQQNQDKLPMINESFIENEVANIRKAENQQLDVSKWQEDLPEDLKKCPKAVISASMAYGDNPDEVRTVLQAKMNAMKKPASTSLDEAFEPIKDLLQRIKKSKLPNLFDAVLQFKDDEIDRADRMFYSEARQYLKEAMLYTYESAHDQVLAIRLMNFHSDDIKDLQNLICEQTNFNDAYAYLQNLTKERSRQQLPRTPDTNKSYNNGKYDRSIVSQATDSHSSAYNSTSGYPNSPPTPGVHYLNPSYQRSDNGNPTSVYNSDYAPRGSKRQ